MIFNQLFFFSLIPIVSPYFFFSHFFPFFPHSFFPISFLSCTSRDLFPFFSPHSSFLISFPFSPIFSTLICPILLDSLVNSQEHNIWCSPPPTRDACRLPITVFTHLSSTSYLYFSLCSLFFSPASSVFHCCRRYTPLLFSLFCRVEVILHAS